MRVACVVSGCALVCVFIAGHAWSSTAPSAESAPGGAPVRHFHVSATPGPLLLNEILAGPARDWDSGGTFSSRDDEWVELINAGGSTIDLSAYFLTDADTIPRCALTGSLAAGERVVVFGRQAYDWEKANGLPSFGLSLGNSGDAVMLWQGLASDTTLVDSYAYTSHEAAADRAIGRIPEGTGSWGLFDALNPYTGTIDPMGNGCGPSPGGPNTCASTSDRSMTWGRVKALYR